MDHIFRIAFCMLSISYLQGKPTTTSTNTLTFDDAIIKDILWDTEKLLNSPVTCAKGSTFYTADFTKECLGAALHCTLSELEDVAVKCPEHESHVENIMGSLENLESTIGTGISSKCKCKKKNSANNRKQLKGFIENLRTGLQMIQSQ